MKKKCFTVFLSFFALALIVAPVRGGYFSIGDLTGCPLAHLLGSICYFGLTLFFLYRYQGKVKPQFIILWAIIGATILDAPFHIFDFKRTLVSLPDTAIRYFVIPAAYLVYKLRNNLCKVLCTLLFLVFSVWSAIQGYNYWYNYLDFGSFTGQTECQLEAPIVFQNSENEEIDLMNESEAKYFVLDFWASFCGVCFREFPKVQELYDELSTRPEIELYSVFCRNPKQNETPKWGANRLEKLGYTFPTISIDGTLMQELGIHGVPTVLILDRNNTVIFRGDIDLATKYVRKLKR